MGGSWWSPVVRLSLCAPPSGLGVRHHVARQPGGVGGEAARGEMVETHAVRGVSDGGLDLGVAAMVSLQVAVEGDADSVGVVK